MSRIKRIRTAVVVTVAAALFTAGALVGQNKFGQPKSVIHVVTVKWKEGTTEAQRNAAIQGVAKLAGAYPGIRNVWLRSISVQGAGYTHAFVMEFESEQALKEYSGSAAQKAWYEVYLPVREESTTHDITN